MARKHVEINSIAMRGREYRKQWLVKVLLVLLTFHCSLFTSLAQDEPEYRLEIGAGAGTVTYLGDYNTNLLKNAQPWGAVVGKYKFNPRMAVAMTIGYGKLKGSTADANTWYPSEDRQFNYKMVDAGLRYEYNFWAYGTGREYRGARPLTPFIALGLGAIYHGGAEKGLAVNLPFGAGVKYKLGNRLNLTAEWRMHFSMSDKLDGVEDPYGIKSTGIFKNTDCFSILQVALTYDFWAKCKTCHNDRD